MRGRCAPYDPLLDRVVLHGGESGEFLLGDTWAWDGTAWTLLATGGPKLCDAGLAFDARRGRLVMFGGRVADPAGPIQTDALYELVGTAWQLIDTVERPAARFEHGMAFDSSRGRVVVTGGVTLLPDRSIAPLDDTWEWDGTQWENRTVTPPFTGASTAIDLPAHAYVLVLASNGLARYEAGQLGVKLRTAAHPPIRADHAAAIDFEGREILLFGGQDLNVVGTLPDTWIWRGGWKELPIAGGPEARFDAAMAFDPIHRHYVMFGGTSPSKPDLDETWVFEAGAWRQVTTQNTPQERREASMVFDETSAQVLLFGGLRGNSVALADLWRWTGTEWALVTNEGPDGPSKRGGAAMAYDPIRRHVVLFGGHIDAAQQGVNLDDTWTWDGTAWTEHFGPGPSGRHHSAMAWNHARQRIVLFGGKFGAGAAAGNDTWEWTGSGWEPLQVAGPLALGGHTLAPMFDGTGVMAIAGQNSALLASEALQLLRFDLAGADETCGASDVDRDGKTRCEDPDCWTVCNVACPPGVTCTSPPSCSDLSCDPARESCTTCEEDCGTCATPCGDAVCEPDEMAACPGDCS
jgi:hypothetical protein